MDSLKHNIWEDLFGITIGAVLLSVGINILENGEILTGGTAGLALLIAHQFSQNVAIIYPLVSAPFLLLSWFKKGKIFTIRTALTVLYVSFLVNLVPQIMHIDVKNDLLASLISNIFLTMGLLALFRHNSSVGGFGVVALIAQEQFNPVTLDPQTQRFGYVVSAPIENVIPGPRTQGRFLVRPPYSTLDLVPANISIDFATDQLFPPQAVAIYQYDEDDNGWRSLPGMIEL